MPKPKDENKTRQIHEATLRLVIQNGFAGLKMAEVAKATGIATGTLYIYYPGKEELINGLYVETKMEIISVLLDTGHHDVNVYKTIRNLWFAYFSFCFHNPQKMMFVEQFLYSGLVSKANLDMTESKMAPFNQFLASAMDQGVIRFMDIEILKAHIQGSLHEIVKLLHKESKSVTVKDKELFFELMWNSIRK